MSALLQLVPRRDAAGAILFTSGVATPDHWHNGIPYEADGSVALSTAPVDHYHQGLAFDAVGRLIGAGAGLDHWGSGAAPMTATSVLFTGTGAPTRYANGVGYLAPGNVAFGV